MATVGATAKCPYCLEEVKPGAMICKHCGTPLRKMPKKKVVPWWRTNFMFGFYTGIVIMILLIVLYNRTF